MQAKDTLSGKQATCYITIDGNRYTLAQAKNVDATYEKNKTEVAILGKMNSGNRSTGGKGSGSCTMYYNTSILRKAMEHYKDTGEDFYFDMQVTNEDSTSSVGRQTTILKDCNLDSIKVAYFNVEDEVLEEDINFTFEDWTIPESFNNIEAMN